MFRLFYRTILPILCFTAMLLSTLSCVNINMPQSPADNKTSQVNQAAPPATAELPIIESFSASPESLTKGLSSTLTWNVKYATSVLIVPDIGNVAATGSKIVKPETNIIYTLVASNDAGINSKVVNINILTPRSATDFTKVPGTAIDIKKQSDLPPIAALPTIESFTATNPKNMGDNSYILTWSVKNADSIAITPDFFQLPATGAVVVTLSKTTMYTLVATNAVGSSYKSVTTKTFADIWKEAGQGE